MPIWTGPLALPPPAQPLQGLCLSVPSSVHASSTLLPKNAKLAMLAFIDPAKIPFWMAAGPTLDVSTTREEMQGWFRKVFCGDRAVGEGWEGEDMNELRQCQVGVLVRVTAGDAAGEETDTESGGLGGKGDWAVSELLIFGRLETRTIEAGATPPRSSPADREVPGKGKKEGCKEVREGKDDEQGEGWTEATTAATTTTTKVITSITLHALPLTHNHNFLSPLLAIRPPSPEPENSNLKLTIPQNNAIPEKNKVPLTPTNKSKLNHLSIQKASFLLPNPLDSPQISKSVKKRRADVLTQAVENRKKNRFGSVVPPPPQPGPPQPGSREGVLSRRASIITGGFSREQSFSQPFKREGTTASIRDRDWERDEWDEFNEALNPSSGLRSPSPEKTSLKSRPGTSSTTISRPGTSVSGAMPVIKKEPSFTSMSSFSSATWPKLPPAPVSRQGSRVPSGSGAALRKWEQRASGAGLSNAISPTNTSPAAVGGAAGSPTLTSATSPTAIQVLDVTMEAHNKDALSRMVLSGMRLYGLKRPSSSSTTSSAASAAEAAEYKFVYHNTFKGAVFALRAKMGVEIIEGGILGGVVERLLGLFCGEAGGGVGGGLGGGRSSPLASALVEIEGLKGRVRELEREVAKGWKKEE